MKLFLITMYLVLPLSWITDASPLKGEIRNTLDDLLPYNLGQYHSRNVRLKLKKRKAPEVIDKREDERTDKPTYKTTADVERAMAILGETKGEIDKEINAIVKTRDVEILAKQSFEDSLAKLAALETALISAKKSLERAVALDVQELKSEREEIRKDHHSAMVLSEELQIVRNEEQRLKEEDQGCNTTQAPDAECDQVASGGKPRAKRLTYT